jgi:penicillin amidase
MYAPDGRFGADPIAGRNALLVKSLEEAARGTLEALRSGHGEMEAGRISLRAHSQSDDGRRKPELRDEVRRRNFPRGGDGFTVTATGGGDNQTTGGSFKIVVDTENWDNSVGLNSPGQSGDVNDPHYRDLYELWARGKYFPIFYSRSKVESVTEPLKLFETSRRIVRAWEVPGEVRGQHRGRYQ